MFWDSETIYIRGLKLIWGRGPHCKISVSRRAALFLETTKCTNYYKWQNYNIVTVLCIMGQGARAPIKFGKIFFRQLSCQIRAFFGQISRKIRAFCYFFIHNCWAKISSPKVDWAPTPMILFMMQRVNVCARYTFYTRTAICRRQMTMDFIRDICDRICVFPFLLKTSIFIYNLSHFRRRRRRQ